MWEHQKINIASWGWVAFWYKTWDPLCSITRDWNRLDCDVPWYFYPDHYCHVLSCSLSLSCPCSCVDMAVFFVLSSLYEDAQWIIVKHDNEWDWFCTFYYSRILVLKALLWMFAMHYDTSYLSMLIICQNMLLVKLSDVTALAQWYGIWQSQVFAPYVVTCSPLHNVTGILFTKFSWYRYIFVWYLCSFLNFYRLTIVYNLTPFILDLWYWWMLVATILHDSCNFLYITYNKYLVQTPLGVVRSGLKTKRPF